MTPAWLATAFGVRAERPTLVGSRPAAICLRQRSHRRSSIATAQSLSLDYKRLVQPVGRFHGSRAMLRVQGPPGSSPQTQACRSGETLGTAPLLSSGSHQATFCGRSGSGCRHPQTVSPQFEGRSSKLYDRPIQRLQLVGSGRQYPSSQASASRAGRSPEAIFCIISSTFLRGTLRICRGSPSPSTCSNVTYPP